MRMRNGHRPGRPPACRRHNQAPSGSTHRRRWRRCQASLSCAAGQGQRDFSESPRARLQATAHATLPREGGGSPTLPTHPSGCSGQHADRTSPRGGPGSTPRRTPPRREREALHGIGSLRDHQLWGQVPSGVRNHRDGFRLGVAQSGAQLLRERNVAAGGSSGAMTTEHAGRHRPSGRRQPRSTAVLRQQDEGAGASPRGST